MFSLIHLGILVLVVVAGVVVYKLWKAHKAVTAAAVVAGVEADVKAAAPSVVAAVEKVVTKN